MTSGNLNEIHMPPAGDPAMDWAVLREYAMRWRRYELAKLGLAGAFRLAAAAAKRVSDALQGLDGPHLYAVPGGDEDPSATKGTGSSAP